MKRENKIESTVNDLDNTCVLSGTRELNRIPTTESTLYL